MSHNTTFPTSLFFSLNQLTVIHSLSILRDTLLYRAGVRTGSLASSSPYAATVVFTRPLSTQPRWPTEQTGFSNRTLQLERYGYPWCCTVNL